MVSYANKLLTLGAGSSSEPEEEGLLATTEEEHHESAAPPPHVLAAAHSLFAIQRGRPAATDAEAMEYVHAMMAARAATAPPTGAEASLSIPPNVLSAATNLFEAHHGRKASSASEALECVRGLVPKVKEVVARELEQPATDCAPSSSTEEATTHSQQRAQMRTESQISIGVGNGRGEPDACANCGHPVCSFDRTCQRCGQTVLASAEAAARAASRAGAQSALEARCDALERSGCCRLFGACFGATPCAIRRALLVGK